MPTKNRLRKNSATANFSMALTPDFKRVIGQLHSLTGTNTTALIEMALAFASPPEPGRATAAIKTPAGARLGLRLSAQSIRAIDRREQTGLTRSDAVRQAVKDLLEDMEGRRRIE